MRRLISYITAFLFAVAPSVNWASIPGTFINYHKDHQQLNLDKIGQIHRSLQSEKINTGIYIPTNMTASTSQEYIFTKIASHNVNNFMKSSMFQKSNLGYATQKLRTITNASMTIKPDNSEISHKISMDFKPVETSASLSYSGYISASINYTADYGANLRLSKQLNKKTYLSYTHQETYDGVSVAWTW